MCEMKSRLTEEGAMFSFAMRFDADCPSHAHTQTAQVHAWTKCARKSGTVTTPLHLTTVKKPHIFVEADDRHCWFLE